MFGFFFSITHHSSLNFRHSSLNFCHSSLITYHLKHPTLFGIITHLSSLNIFYTVCGPHTCHLVRAKLFCYPRNPFPTIFSFLISPSPLLLSQNTNPNPSSNTITKIATTTTKYGNQTANSTSTSAGDDESIWRRRADKHRDVADQI